MTSDTPAKVQARAFALLPLIVFLAIFLGSGIYHSLIGAELAFYQVKAPVAALPAIILAVLLYRGKLNAGIDAFLKGASHPNLILMFMVFMLAGAFASVSSAIGSVDATVQLGLSIIPPEFVLPMLFLISAFIATAMGTSMGTIAACAPIAFGFTQATDIEPVYAIGAVVGGAMFGDNLSFISDTTIVATRTQGCQMSDKFKVNIRIALPIAILTGLIYVLVGSGVENAYAPAPIEWVKVIPYLVVLVTAVCGINVMLVLFIGIVLSGIVGLWTGSFDIWGWNASMGLGITNMGELIIVTLLAGGMLEMIRYNGGIDWIIRKLTSRIHSSKGAEMSIAALVSFANLCTANNTIALIMAGPIAKDIADRFKIDPRRSASLLDIFSCFVQGIIPYGAQMLMAAGLGHVSPIEIMQYLYYPYLLGAGALLAIAFNYPRKYTVN